MSTPARFWAKVDRRSEGECWPWTGATGSGYGRFAYRGRLWSSHRLAYLFGRGRDPGDSHVCHACDNKLCCNPTHLWLGTHTDNMRDKVAKGRSNCGGPLRKLNERQVERIRHDDRSAPAIAADYGVTPACIRHIRTGKNWAHRDAPVLPTPKKLTEEQVRRILADQRGLAVIAAEYGVSKVTIHCIRVGKTWKHLNSDTRRFHDSLGQARVGVGDGQHASTPVSLSAEP